MSEFVTFMDSADAASRRLCAEQPDQAAVRSALLALEKDVHRHQGWDSDPQIFQMLRDRWSGEPTLSRWPFATGLIARENARGVETAEVLENLASVLEDVRAKIDGRDPVDSDAVGRADLSPEDYRRVLGIGRGAAGADLAGTPESRFHGVGLVAECWAALGIGEQEGREIAGLSERRMVNLHPHRMEVRQVMFSARDGYVWQVWRIRNTPGMALSRYCTALRAEDDLHVNGAITESLTRICNAIANNPVPVVRYETGL